VIACSTGVSKEATPSVEELFAEFQLFRSASESLEKAYGELREQAKRVDHELAEANRRLRQGLAEREDILGALPLGVFRRSSTGLLAVNPVARSLIQGVGMSVLLSELESRESSLLSVKDRQGKARSLHVTSVEIGDEGVMLEFVDDRTEVEAMREELDRLARLSSLSELALGVAHEVRNPLNGIAGFAGMLKRCPDSPKAAHWAERIEEGAWRVDRIVGDLLAFARPKERVEAVSRSLAAWLTEARAELPGLEIVLDSRAQESELRGSPQALGKVFANLLRNAHEAGASCVTISTHEAEDGRLRVDVQDDGAGIPEDIQGRIFDPFVGSKDEGTGLGLAFCARALEAMEGRILCRSNPKVACFTLELGGHCRV